jgi:hypothetical protein
MVNTCVNVCFKSFWLAAMFEQSLVYIRINLGAGSNVLLHIKYINRTISITLEGALPPFPGRSSRRDRSALCRHRTGAKNNRITSR